MARLLLLLGLFSPCLANDEVAFVQLAPSASFATVTPATARKEIFGALKQFPGFPPELAGLMESLAGGAGRTKSGAWSPMALSKQLMTSLDTFGIAPGLTNYMQNVPGLFLMSEDPEGVPMESDIMDPQLLVNSVLGYMTSQLKNHTEDPMAQDIGEILAYVTETTGKGEPVDPQRITELFSSAIKRQESWLPPVFSDAAELILGAVAGKEPEPADIAKIFAEIIQEQAKQSGLPEEAQGLIKEFATLATPGAKKPNAFQLMNDVATARVLASKLQESHPGATRQFSMLSKLAGPVMGSMMGGQ